MDDRRTEVRLPEIITVYNLQIFQAVFQPTQPSRQTLRWGFVRGIKAAEA
jgi:hypothetical protein